MKSVVSLPLNGSVWRICYGPFFFALKKVHVINAKSDVSEIAVTY